MFFSKISVTQYIQGSNQCNSTYPYNLFRQVWINEAVHLANNKWLPRSEVFQILVKGDLKFPGKNHVIWSTIPGKDLP